MTRHIATTRSRSIVHVARLAGDAGNGIGHGHHIGSRQGLQIDRAADLALRLVQRASRPAEGSEDASLCASFLPAVRAAVRTIGTVRPPSAPFVSAVHSSVTLPLRARLDAIRIHHRRGYHVQWMCGIAADPNGISNRQFFSGLDPLLVEHNVLTVIQARGVGTP